MNIIEAARTAILDDLRDRKLLKYLFAENPETRGAYGYVDAPIDTATQNEIAESLTRAVLRAMREPSEAMVKAGDAKYHSWPVGGGEPWFEGSDEVWQTMIDAALGEK